ncbi:DNA-binding transcriptional regulator KdgR [Paucibacter sp. O1-1]|uniref:DNA-binding transcriptional regulator KdgR n=2 Tax=unclassified Roseateles TaxID=2626991 RepID=UPI0010F758D8|nr:DNA-binding transcriptional regulator KdgR [Paucibacter sp. M5-1]MCU7371878.1 DNA-binding transcriptional regulator KdgR [Paucibacter sp. O1-1]MCZ7880912.1 DNA-binding transcriptional regulator KdgR [Paucibacter sp. M5-1]MDA3826868.1 DNA-binding transcriptional regulator KdgR [Paucibacter sp. O1-1]
MDDDLNDGKQQPESVAAVLKVFAILQALSERSETGISDLSVRLAMPKATVYRFLQTMMTLGYVRQEADSERYGLTMKAFELGTKALQYPELIDLAKHHMQMLADATGETVHLGTLIDSEIIYVHKVDSRHMLGMYSRVGRRAPLHCTAIGKVLMAWEHPQRRERILQGAEFKRFRDKTIVEPAAFQAELDRVKAQGFGEDREEFDDHIRCLGVPIFDRLNQPIAGLSVSFPTFRYDEAKEGEVVAMLQGASRDISARLGCTQFPLDPPAKAARART